MKNNTIIEDPLAVLVDQLLAIPVGRSAIVALPITKTERLPLISCAYCILFNTSACKHIKCSLDNYIYVIS